MNKYSVRLYSSEVIHSIRENDNCNYGVAQAPLHLLLLIVQQRGRLGFKSNGQLQKSGKGNVDHSLFDLCDLAVIDATGIRHFTETESFVLTELSQIFSKSF